MKKIIAIALSLVILVACLAVARWAQNNTRVNGPEDQPSVPNPETTTATPTYTTAPTQPQPTKNPDDIENGLGWG